MAFTASQRATLDFVESLGVRIVEGPPPAGSRLDRLQRLSAAMQDGLITEEDMRAAVRRDMRRQVDVGE